MTWRYTGTPLDNDRDAIRFLSGQTSSSAPFAVSDEEIAFLLAQEGGQYGAAAAVCELQARSFSEKASSKTVGSLTVSYANRVTDLTSRAKGLRLNGNTRGVVPYAGGISVSDKAANVANTDNLAPSFRLGMDDDGQAST